VRLSVIGTICIFSLLQTVLGLAAGSASKSWAQTVPKSLEEGGSEAALRVRKNSWTVGVAGGQLTGTFMTFANELAEVLNDGDNLRVIPVVTYGAASNLEDLLYLKNIDVAVTQADVFEYFRTQRKVSNLETRVNYILRLPTRCTFSPRATSTLWTIFAGRK
jgi:hypothetical protein